VILTEGTTLESVELFSKNQPSVGLHPVMTLEERERLHILDVLEKTNWRVSGKQGAADLLGLKSTTLEARMKKLSISRKK
jgi:transcriptional regulator with GAF, ATPase, and Fis domain